MSAPAPARLLTPALQREVDALVFKTPKTPPKTKTPPKAAAPSAYLVQSLGEKAVPVLPGQMTHAGRDTEDHFSGNAMGDHADGSTPFDRVYNQEHKNKDTDDHFGHGMVMADDNDVSNSFDRVYDSRHVEKDTADHFDGMLMAADEQSIEEDARREATLKKYHAAKERYEADLAVFEEADHMGHEQLDAKDHFSSGMNFHSYLDGEGPENGEDDPPDDPIVKLAAAPDPLNTFERVFGAESDALPPPNYPPGTFSIGPPGLQISMDMRYYPQLGKADMRPPDRPKFLHGVKYTAQPPPYSSAMQMHLDSLVVMGRDGKVVGGGSQSARGPMVRAPAPASWRSLVSPIFGEGADRSAEKKAVASGPDEMEA